MGEIKEDGGREIGKDWITAEKIKIRDGGGGKETERRGCGREGGGRSRIGKLGRDMQRDGEATEWEGGEAGERNWGEGERRRGAP